ncbi:Transcriptional activator of fatty acid utilization [Mortierella sp. AD011]|nr:Transcriptional activator of fatty acid utilization [Mortierella sp. AD010]KAF9403164.1 Transcriptional activator of fatty acid utilization [Mortierella sp. AD011]
MSPTSRRSESKSDTSAPSAQRQQDTSTTNNNSGTNIINFNPNSDSSDFDYLANAGPSDQASAVTITSNAGSVLHSNLTGGIRHSTANTQDNNTADIFQGISIRNRDVFVNVTPSQTRGQFNNTIVNPYWPSQHRQHTTRTGLDHQMPISPSTPVPAEPIRVVPSTPKPLNQNQVHAQTHPWRIKVYNACLACRKKKIKCDGLPTCGRCARLGFECSYIEVPQAPESKNAKQKTRSHLGVATTIPASGSGKSIAKEHPQSEAVDTAKEICWERRPSTKDAASRSVPHPTSQRLEESPHHRKDIVSEQLITSIGSVAQAPTKDQQASSSASEQLDSEPVVALAMDRDAAMPDLYHILVSSVAIPNVSIFPHSASQTSSPTTGPVGSGFSIGMVHLNLTLAQQAIPNIGVLDVDSTNTDQHGLSFQKDPLANSSLDQTTPLGFVITNKSVIQYLVHVYFECFHVHWMIVDKEKFLAQLKNPATPPDPLLLVAMCAAGAKCSDHEGLCTEPGNLPTIGEQFLTHARILLQDRFDMASMSTLQALLILYWCQVQTGRASLRFMYAGMAIRMAQEMGLNRHIDPKRLKGMDEREVQIRKTIWWSCYQADRWTSAALGKPMVISDIDCLVDYPSSITENERYHIQSFCHMTDLAKILGKVLLNLYTSTSASTCSSAVFSHLDQSLSAWIDSVPSTSSDQEKVSHTPASLDKSEEIPSRKISNLQHGKSALPVSNHQETNEDTKPLSTPKLGPGSVEYHALLYHTLSLLLCSRFRADAESQQLRSQR